MFENYGKKTETDNVYQRIGLMSLLMVFVGLPAMIYLNIKDESPNPQLDHTVSFSDEQTEQSVEDICKSLPLPEKLKFIGKSEPKNDYEQRLVIYQYQSERSPEEIMPAFLLWFSQNGWQPAPSTDSTYRKGNQSIFIWATKNAYGNQVNYYDIYCSEKR